MSALDDLRGEIDGWLSGLLGPHVVRRVRESKVIRDPVNGFEVFTPPEVALIDSPVLQRLRRIHQTALAYYVYPGADHTRFAHSLGVAHLAGRMAGVLRDRGAEVDEADIAEVRLAGLLHDTGHGLFSHLSESMFEEQFKAQVDAIGNVDPRFKEKPLGEIMSFLITTSPRFMEFIQEIYDGHGLPTPNLERVAHYFLGSAPAGEPQRQCIAEIISSPLDADKLDYFARDCHYTGIRAEIDVDRLLVSIDVDSRSNSDHRHIVVKQSGVHHLEHIIFSKMMLYSSVYHQHKIRALECGVRGIFRKLWSGDGVGAQSLKFSTLGSLLHITEDQFWVEARSEPAISEAVGGFLDSRYVPMRALALSMSSLRDDEERKDNLRKLWDMGELPERQRLVGDTIRAALPKEVDPVRFGVWFDVPKTPPVSKDAKRALVDVGDDYVALGRFFPSDEWVDAYTDNKMVAHVFTDPDPAIRVMVAEAAREYFEQDHQLKLTDRAISRCFKEGEGDYERLLRGS